MHWCAPYIGLPYKELGRDLAGLDCWGLVRVVYKDRFNVELPEHANAVFGLIQAVAAAPQAEGWRLVDTPEDGDAVALGKGRVLHHVGVYVCVPRASVLHVNPKAGVILQTLPVLRGAGWSNIKFYRYDSRRRS